MKIVAFLMRDSVADRIIDHLKLTFVAEKPSLESVLYIFQSKRPSNPVENGPRSNILIFIPEGKLGFQDKIGFVTVVSRKWN